MSTWTVLCNFCAKTYRVDYETQKGVHGVLYKNKNKVKYYNSANREVRRRQHNGSNVTDNDDNDENDELREVQYKRRYDGRDSNNLKECRLKNVEYSLPLFGVSTSVSGLASTRNINKKRERLNEIYSIPASMCPPLLTILIDGTSTDPKYYRKICSSLNQLLYHCQNNNDYDGISNNDNIDEKENGGDNNSSNRSNGYGKSSTTANFKGCKIGIFVMTKGGGLSVFDLKSPGGHVKHFWVQPSPLQRNEEFVSNDNNNNTNMNFVGDSFDRDDLAMLQGGRNHIIPLSEILDVDDIYVSLDNEYSRSCVEGALRGLADSTIFNQACQRNNINFGSSGSNNNGVNNVYGGGGAYFGSTIQYILEFMDEVAYHPGMYQAPREQLVHDNESSDTNSVENCAVDRFLYAGGKIMCFLAGPPNEIGSVVSHRPFGRIGTGGFGGSCAEIGRRFSANKDVDKKNSTSTISSNPEEFEDDIEAGNMNSKKSNGRSKRKSDKNKNPSDMEIPHMAFLNVDQYYQSLGIQCAHQALSVEVFGIVSEEEGIYLGFPYLRLLSDRSGGSGPLLISLSNNEQVYRDYNNCFEDDVLTKEVIARSTLTR